MADAIWNDRYVLQGEPDVKTDNTLSGNGTLTSPLGVVPGYNETVLYQAPTLSGVTACTLSESIKNFQYLGLQPTRFFSSPTPSKTGGTGPICYYNTDTLWRNTGEASDEKSFTYPCPIIYEWQWWKMGQYSTNNDWTQLVHISGMWYNVFTHTASQSGTHVGLYRVIGINRKQ